MEVRFDDYDDSFGCEPVLLFWYVTAGDSVADGQDLCEVESAKAVSVVTSPCDGIVEAVMCAEAAAVESGHVLATIRRV